MSSLDERKAEILRKAYAGVVVPLALTDVMEAVRLGINRGVEVCYAEMGGNVMLLDERDALAKAQAEQPKD